MNDKPNHDPDEVDRLVALLADGIEAEEDIRIEVPPNRCLPGYQWGKPAQWTEESLRSYVLIQMYRFMDVERFEAAAEAARRDPDDVLAAALTLKRQAEAAKQARAPWVDATPAMINAAAREADEKRLAHAQAIRSKHASDKSNAARQAKQDQELETIAHFYRSVADEARRNGGKVPGYRDLNKLARKAFKAKHAQTEQGRSSAEFQQFEKLLTETRARRWLERNNTR
jgi:hypothetical protein